MTKAADQRATKLAKILREKERLIEDLEPALLSIPAEYIRALAALRHFAFYGDSGGDRVGSHSQPGSRPPQHDSAAFGVLERERKALLRRVKDIPARYRVDEQDAKALEIGHSTLPKVGE